MKKTIGEAAKEWLLRYAKEINSDPFELTLNCGDVSALYEIGKMSGDLIREKEHPWDYTRRILNAIRKSPLFECRGYYSLLERG